MNKIYFTILKVIVVITVLIVFFYSIYQKVNERTSAIQTRIADAEELIKSSKKQKKIQFVGNDELGYLIQNNKSNIYVKDLKDTTKIIQLLRMLDSTIIMQQYGKIQ